MPSDTATEARQAWTAIVAAHGPHDPRVRHAKTAAARLPAQDWTYQALLDAYDTAPCPQHADCERYLPATACEYRSGAITYAEAENRADTAGGAPVGGCTDWAGNE